MIVLGLSFSHDASMTLLADGELVAYSEVERTRRVKHAAFLTSKEITSFLDENGITLSDVDICSILCIESSSKEPEINRAGIIDFYSEIEIKTGAHNYSKFIEQNDVEGFKVIESTPKIVPFHLYDFLEFYEHDQNQAISFDHISNHAVFATDLRRHMFRPAHFSINKLSAKRTFLVSHHAAHAQYSFSFSKYEKALIITLDGEFKQGFRGGGIYFGIGQNIYPQVAHSSGAGWVYAALGPVLIGPDTIDLGTPGKVMGLSAYGTPVYYTDAYSGTLQEMLNNENFKNESGNFHFHRPLYKKVLPDFDLFNNSLKNYWDMASDPPALHANVAASVQAIFFDCVTKLVDSAVQFANRVGFKYDGICLSGGAFLNCPTNSFLYNKYHNVFIPPAVNDEGLSLGAALMFENSFNKQEVTPRIAYLGKQYDVDAFMKQFDEFADKMQIVARGDDSLHRLAQELHDGKTAGFFHGRSEVGPRALGHRSILAATSDCQTSLRVNRIKNREKWRPFAPIMTEETLTSSFIGAPADSYFMLFNAKARNACFPAITHVDGTARVQVATPESGPVYDLLKIFGAISGHEILLNTSFNGRGEPIVETPRDACLAFLNMPLDLLYLEGYLFVKKYSMDQT
ncbi:MAG: hypothetical protein H7836_16915 [Magnetococcus sp. YQC-3]